MIGTISKDKLLSFTKFFHDQGIDVNVDSDSRGNIYNIRFSKDEKSVVVEAESKNIRMPGSFLTSDEIVEEPVLNIRLNNY